MSECLAPVQNRGLCTAGAELARDRRAFTAVTLVQGRDPWTEVTRLGITRDPAPSRALLRYVRRLRVLLRAARDGAGV